MHILVVSQYYWPESFRINDLVEGLVERGHRVTVLTGIPNYPAGRPFAGYGAGGPWREHHGGADIVRVPLMPRGRGGGVRLALNYLSFALSASLFGPFRCRDRYDAILVFAPSPPTVGIPALAIAARHATPVLFWVQDLWPESLSATGAVRAPWILKAVERMVRRIYRGCRYVLVQSEGFVAPVIRLGVPSERIRYFPNSAEGLYQPLPVNSPREGPVLPQGFRVMFAGNIGTAQSFETTLAAAELLKEHEDIHWVLVGDGRLSSWLKEEINRRRLGRCVHPMGRFPLESMPSWFAQADVMLVALRREAVFSMTIPAKIQSYMACAKPILAALDGEGARVVTLSGAGFSVPAENPKALADAVLELSRMSATERNEMGRSGRAYFEKHFERNALLGRLEGWLHEVKAERQ